MEERIVKHLSAAVVAAFAGALVVAEHVSAQTCPGDFNGDGSVTVDEVLVVVNTALNGCNPVPTATPTQPTLPSATPTQTAPPTRTATPSRTATPTPRFIDNGNGTITDTTTGLVWEKKSDDGGLHDYNDDPESLYTWSVSGSTGPTGTVFAFIQVLNNTNFAGRRDWRLPTLEELQTIVSTGGITPGRPVVPPAFDDDCVPGCNITQCSCTRPLNYWTRTVNAANAQQAWYVLFNSGQSGTAFKTLALPARAVSGGN
jgi:hypothetical protein